MDIASVHSAFAERGGAERYILEQAHQIKRYHRVVLFAAYSRTTDCYPELMNDLEIHELVGLRLPKLDLLSNLTLATLISSKCRKKLCSYDLILSHQEPAHWIAYKSKTPYVVQIHSLMTLLYPKFTEIGWSGDYSRLAMEVWAAKFSGRPLLRFMDQTAVRTADMIIAPPGKKIRSAIHEIYGSYPTQIPYGIDFSRHVPLNPCPVFSRYAISKPLILMVARPVPNKRIDLMIQMLPMILKEHPSATLVIACGLGRYVPVWRRLAQQIGVSSSTRILTFSEEELNALYMGANVFAYPSQAPETIGRSVIEAMSFGVPPVVWDNGWGPAEVVTRNTGYRAKPYDLYDFYDKILALLNDDEERRRMGRRAKNHVKESYSWKKVWPRMEKLMKSVL